MQITTFNPMILSKDAEAVIALFEELGFEKKHAPTVDTGKSMVTSTRMKDANGFYLDVTQEASIQRDITGIRISVDDFDEAYNLLVSHGFEQFMEQGTISTPSSKFVLLKSPSGFVINLVQHITG